MKDLIIIAFIIAAGTMSAIIVSGERFSCLSYDPGITIKVCGDVESNTYSQFIAITNRSRKTIETMYVKVNISIPHDCIRNDEFHHISDGGNVSIRLLVSDADGFFAGGRTFFIGNTECQVNWDDGDSYTGMLECSYGDSVVKKYLTIERNDHSVRMYIHDY